MPARLEPGTAAFAAALLARLKADPAVGPAVALDAARASSRNTVLYRARAGSRRLICKAAIASPDASVPEYRMLIDLRSRLAGTAYDCVEAVAVYPELSVLVTREQTGLSVRDYVDRALSARPTSAEYVFAEELMDRCAGCLFQFHSGFGIERDPAGTEWAWSYLDIDPRNLLVPHDAAPSLVMLDPPPRMRRRRLQFDLATFCYGVARAGFTPMGFARFSQRRIDRLKAAFLAGYFRRLGRALTADDLATLERFEGKRARRAQYRYRQFYRYRNWPLELARMAYFAPLIGAYARFQLPLSYRRIARMTLE